MSADASADMRKPRRLRLAWLLVAAGVLVFAGANAHLVYVAFTSHPGCIPHLKETGERSGEFRAATSDC